MRNGFEAEIAHALGPEMAPDVRPEVTKRAALPAWFDVTGLAVASVGAAAAELGALLPARQVSVTARHALMWFGMGIRPMGWELPSPWDAVAGDYRAADGWLRLHTNAPHHRKAALAVLGVPADRAAVAQAVSGWRKADLESAVVAAGGAAAAMWGAAEWADHPQGRAVAAEPLIAWQESGATRRRGGLEGLRVLDLTRVLAGPVATRFLAGFGAEVLRIDPPDWSEPGVEPEVTLGKRCAGLDLTRAADRARFERLLDGADVVVHGYRPGALEALGYGAEALRGLAPEAITVTLDAYGWQGPWAGRRGFDSLVQMSCGIAEAGMRLSGAEKPVPLPVQALDHATGYLMAAAVLRALRLRQAQGRVLSARLSLARTAMLLMSAGEGWRAGDMAAEGDSDLAPEIEATGWGPARRIRFPVVLDGQGPRWPHPAGPLRRDAPVWAQD